MYLYSIMPLDAEHVEETCRDIREQYRSGVATCALMMMTLVPEDDPPIDKAGIYCETFDKIRDRLAETGDQCGILVQASIGHGYSAFSAMSACRTAWSATSSAPMTKASAAISAR